MIRRSSHTAKVPNACEYIVPPFSHSRPSGPMRPSKNASPAFTLPLYGPKRCVLPCAMNGNSAIPVAPLTAMGKSPGSLHCATFPAAMIETPASGIELMLREPMQAHSTACSLSGVAPALSCMSSQVFGGGDGVPDDMTGDASAAGGAAGADGARLIKTAATAAVAARPPKLAKDWRSFEVGIGFPLCRAN